MPRAPSTKARTSGFVSGFQRTTFAHQPIEPPEVIFVDTPPIHEHVYSNGFICLSILYDEWSAVLTVSSVCQSILSMISSAKVKKKPANDMDLVVRSKGKSPKDFSWSYEDDKC